MSVQLATFAGAPEGMVRAKSQHELEDTQCWTIIDAFLNQDGYITRRAGLATSVGSVSAASSVGIAATVSPAGVWAAAQVTKRTSDSFLRIEGFKNTTIAESLAGAGPTVYFDSKDALGGGCLIGSSDGLGPASTTTQSLVIWRGASLGAPVNASYTPSPLVTVGAATVTLTANGAHWVPGHFIFDTTSGDLIGVVKSVSGNVLTLTAPALRSSTGANTVFGSSWRGLQRRVSKGRITTSTASAVVNGGATLFRANGMGSGTWDIFTTEYNFVGTVSAVGSDSQLTLTGNASIALLNSDYIAIKRGAGYAGTNEVFGWLNANYAGHQFYATGARVSYSDDDHFEAVDVDHDFFEVSEENVSALIPAQQGLVICTETEAHVLLGAVGTTPDRWRADRIHDDGCLSPMTARLYQGGAIWAGRRGIWYWNGGEVVNLAGALGDAYQRIIEGMPVGTYLRGAVTHGHYLLSVESTTQTELRSYDTANYANGTAIGNFTICIKLDDGAITLLRNVDVRGVAQPPPQVSGETYLSFTHLSAGVRTARVFPSRDLFAENNATGIDSFACDGVTGTFPAFELETKKYDIGNPQLLKLFKMLLLHYNLWGTQNTAAQVTALTADHLRFATVKGLGSVGALSSKQFFLNGDSQAWLDKRLKFMKRSQHLSIRIWQGTQTITRLQLGAWALGFKPKRPGRV